MRDPRPVTRDMLKGAVYIHRKGESTDFAYAKEMSDQIARKDLADPILLAWFDRNSWTHSPAIC
jgi:hypothetical protein